MDIPYTISSLRKAGLTQTQIGCAVGLKQTSISDMEAGKAGVKRPSYAVVSALQKLAADHAVKTEPPSESVLGSMAAKALAPGPIS